MKGDDVMKFNFKKVFIILVSIITVFSFSILPTHATTYYYHDNFEFYKNDLGGATISSYLADDTYINIPPELLGNTVNVIGASSFSDNTNITSVTLPDTIVLIGSYAFNKCSSLQDITFPNSNLNKIISGAFQDCDSLVNIDLSKTSIKMVDNQLFARCDNLESVILPETVETIESFAFYNCPILNTIVIPKAVNSISSSAFKGSTNVKFICYENSYAHTYAVDKNIPFELILEPTYDLGDVDLSGVIDIKDSTSIQKHLAEIEMFDDTQLSVADFNQDGGINIIDATAIQKYLVS